ncbi:hypothetical_protein (plasmid) [Leishmania braziliensis MHOM/BR/75/M2904]|nr:unnamed protein product [Leishmania braziliensis]SYZ63727.1 hypothetical_protein [Leishmania braziliensis MHOM/BR/75/M2904]
MQRLQYGPQQQLPPPPQQQQQERQSATAEAVDVPYSDANIAMVLSLSPFSEFCKLRDNWTAKPLIRGRYIGMCGGDPAQRERREDFEHITLTSSPSASTHAFGGGARRHTVWGQVEAYSRSAAGKTIDPAQQRTPLALEKSMHFLVEHYLRVPHTHLVYTEAFRIWGYLWDRFRGIRTTWGPQLPPSNVSLHGYVDSETGRMLPMEELHCESYRRVRWLEFTVAALAVGGAYLCCSPDGCQRFMQDKKQFLESMSQCFTDLTVFYRAEQRHRNAELFSVLLLLYGLQQELKVEDRSSFCRFYTVIVNGEPRLCPESASESVNLAQVYRELEKQPYMLETEPVRVVLELIHFWAARQWFQFFSFCKSARMTPLQRAVVFQSFTYGRYRAVLDLVLPNYYVYPKLRVRHAILVAELADQLMMHHEHCLEFLKRMGLDAQLECKTPHQLPPHAADSLYPIMPAPSGATAATFASASERGDKAEWYLNLCHPNSDPVITADELEKRCVNKRVLFFPTYPAFFGFRVSHEAYERFPDAKGFPTTSAEDVRDALVVTSSSSPVVHGTVRPLSGFQDSAGPQSKAGTLSRRSAASTNRSDDGDDGGDEGCHADAYCDEGKQTGRDSPPFFDKEAALLSQLGCPVNLMEVLEAYCPPYHSEVAALRLSDTSEELFASLPAHRAEMLLRCRQLRLQARHWQRTPVRDNTTAALVSDEEALNWAEKMEMESVSTTSSLLNGSGNDDVLDDEGEESHSDEAAARHALGVVVSPLKSDAELPAVISEARQLITAIRDNPLYAAAAAARAEAEAGEKSRQAKQKEADAQRKEAAAEVTRSDQHPSSPPPFPPKPPSQPQRALALPELGPCIVVPLPDNYSDDADQRCNSQNAHVVVESPTTLSTQRLADMIGNNAEAQVVTEGSERGPRDVSTTHQERPQSMSREDSAETVEPHRHIQAQSSASPPPPFSMPPVQFHTPMPEPLMPTAVSVFTPGKREPVVVAGTDTTTPPPAVEQYEGSSTSTSNSSSGSSSAPMLGYSHLKPLKQTLPGDGKDDAESAGDDDDKESELLSSRDKSSSASVVDDVESALNSNNAESGTLVPPIPPLWGGQRPLPVPPPMAVIDSFTPRSPLKKRPASSAAPPASHRIDREVERGVASGNESVEDAVEEVPASVNDEGLWKHHKAETARQPGVFAQRPPSAGIPASSVDVFARACVPLIEEYLHLWMRLTHEDDTTLRTAAQYVLNLREAEATAEATRSANEGGNEADCAALTRRGGLMQRRYRSALRDEKGATATASTWRQQWRLQRTAQAMARVARQLLTTAVLRGSMSEYGQLMWDLSISESEPSTTMGRDAAFGSGLCATEPDRGDAAKARAAQRHRVAYDGSDDARAARLSCGCSAAMLSVGDADVILAAAQVQPAGALARGAYSTITAWPSAPNGSSMRSAASIPVTEESSGLGYAKTTCKSALNKTLSTVFSCGVGAETLPSHDSLASFFSNAIDVSLDSADDCGRSRRCCPAAALQLTSIYIWVSTESYCHRERLVIPASPAGTSAVDSTAFAWLFQNERERWLVSVMLPATSFTAMAVSADVSDRGDDDGRASWLQPNPSRRSGKRRRSSGQNSHVGDDTRGVMWLSEVDIDPHSATSPSPVPLVARLFHRDHFSDVLTVRSTLLAPTHNVGAAAQRYSAVPLMTRITLYGCDAHALPRLRVRRDGGVRLAQQHTCVAATHSPRKAAQVKASPDSTRALAMSHAHYTALLAVDIAEPGYMAKARRVLTAVVASHVARTTAMPARGAPAAAMEWNGHQEGVQEQNCVAGVLVCLLSSPAQVAATAPIVAEIKDVFGDLWHDRHGAGEKSKDGAVSEASTPTVVGVRIVYGDAEGAKAAMKTGMQALLSSYAQQALSVLAGDG